MPQFHSSYQPELQCYHAQTGPCCTPYNFTTAICWVSDALRSFVFLCVLHNLYVFACVVLDFMLLLFFLWTAFFERKNCHEANCIVFFQCVFIWPLVCICLCNARLCALAFMCSAGDRGTFAYLWILFGLCLCLPNGSISMLMLTQIFFSIFLRLLCTYSIAVISPIKSLRPPCFHL